MEAAYERASTSLIEKSIPEVVDEMIGALVGIESEEEQGDDNETKNVNSVDFTIDVQGEEDQQVIEINTEENKEKRSEKKRRIFKKMKVIINKDEGDLKDKEEGNDVIIVE